MNDFINFILGPEVWSLRFLGNSLGDYAVFLGFFLALIVLFSLVYNFLLDRAKKISKKTETGVDDVLVRIISSLKPPFYYFVAFYFATGFLALSQTISDVLMSVLVIWLVYQVILIAHIFVDIVSAKRQSKEEEPGTIAAIDLVAKIGKGVLWVLGILFVLSNLGVNVTSLVAGLGIGGIAVALALQNVLNDLFSSFSIYFDKPFVIGDFIIIGDKAGVVERIGIKSTRIRALQGEEIIVSNRELTTAHIQNFKKMKERRVTFHVGVVYETSNDKLSRIPEMIKQAVEANEKARFDRAHFKEFGDSALVFEVVFYFSSPNFGAYMDTRQSIHLKIKESFEKEGVEIAYPTQTLYLKK